MIDDFLGSINFMKIKKKSRILAWLEAREFVKCKHLVIIMVNNDEKCDIYYPGGVKMRIPYILRIILNLKWPQILSNGMLEPSRRV